MGKKKRSVKAGGAEGETDVQLGPNSPKKVCDVLALEAAR